MYKKEVRKCTYILCIYLMNNFAGLFLNANLLLLILQVVKTFGSQKFAFCKWQLELCTNFLMALFVVL